MRMKKRFEKQGQLWPMEKLGKWALLFFVFVIILLSYLFLKNKGIDAIDYIKNLIRFGR